VDAASRRGEELALDITSKTQKFKEEYGSVGSRWVQSRVVTAHPAGLNNARGCTCWINGKKYGPFCRSAFQAGFQTRIRFELFLRCPPFYSKIRKIAARFTDQNRPNTEANRPNTEANRPKCFIDWGQRVTEMKQIHPILPETCRKAAPGILRIQPIDPRSILYRNLD
jgi:hypothetical protein